MKFIPILLLCCMGFFPAHKHYVSKCFVNYNSESNTLQLSLNLFTDDLEHALKEGKDTQLYLNTDKEVANADSIFLDYLSRHLNISTDQGDVSWNYIGKEEGSNYESIWCYMESDPIPKPGELMVYNTLLLDAFPEQKNIVDYSVDKVAVGSMLFHNDLRKGKISK